VAIGHALSIDPAAVLRWPVDLVGVCCEYLEDVAAAYARAARR
jgi:hypothetical protein